MSDVAVEHNHKVIGHITVCPFRTLTALAGHQRRTARQATHYEA